MANKYTSSAIKNSKMKKQVKQYELTDEEIGRLLYWAISSKSSPRLRKRSFRLLRLWYQILKHSTSEKRKLSREDMNWYLVLRGIANLRLQSHGR